MVIFWFCFLFFFTFVNSGLVDPPIGCTTFPYMPIPVCSARGTCYSVINNTMISITQPNLPNSKCVCDPGWTGANDFVDMTNHDCGIHIPTIQTIWTLIALGSIAEIMLVLHKIKQTLNSDLFISGNTRLTDKHSKRIDKNRLINLPVVRYAFAAVPSDICLLITAPMRIFQTKEILICIDPTVTIFYLVAEMSFWVSYRFMAVSWLRVRRKLALFTQENQQASNLTYSQLNRGLKICYALDFLRSLVLFIVIGNPQLANFMTLIYFQAQTIVVFISGGCTIIAAKGLEKILLDGIDQVSGVAKDERERGLANIRKLIEQERMVIISGITVNMLPPWWPWLRAKASYGIAQILIAKLIQLAHLKSFTVGNSPQQQQSQKISQITTNTNDSSVEKKNGEIQEEISPRDQRPLLEMSEGDLGSSTQTSSPRGMELDEIHAQSEKPLFNPFSSQPIVENREETKDENG